MANKTGWKGIKFPFNFANGKVEISKAIIEDNEFSHINESLKQIIGTVQKERCMSHKVGLKSRMIFKSFSKELIPYYRDIIKEAIIENEKRVIIKDIIFDESLVKDEGKLIIKIYWLLKQYNIPNITEGYIYVNGGE